MIQIKVDLKLIKYLLKALKNMKTRMKPVQIQNQQLLKLKAEKAIKNEGQVIKVPYQQNFCLRVIELINQTKNQSPQKTYIFVYRTQLNLSNDINIKQEHPPKIKQRHKQKLCQVFYFSIFQTLTDLNITKTYLDSCQFLGFINAPSLKNLTLSSNLFTNFKSLVKMNAHSLDYINISGNPGKFFNFERLKLPQILDQLYYESSKIGEIKNEDLSNLVKLQCHFCNRFKLNVKRITQKKIQQNFAKRFEKNHTYGSKFL